ncbi:MoaD/ThiS family protein [Sulfidibacter corallicola]|uniref:MoaD/ThiS family protein n=1 Tax=Sulfidibacter corallicola TaxID=2818388 RepID=A0A8A4TSY2_SULCO|nr:MoaD/ThiS family protein [Sulfidibacter corallicola]QTD52274.1 MoaD/ThiS family protein [Sulfidibacter corallicola]
MAHVQFTRNLKRFFPDLEPVEIQSDTVSDLVRELDVRHPHLASYIVDDRGALRRHVNIFVNERMIQDRETLSDALSTDAKVFIVQALSGG